MTVPWEQAIQVARQWLEADCEILYLDTRYGVVLQLNGLILSMRLSDRWAYVQL